MDEGAELLFAASRLKRDASMLLLVNEGQKSIQQLALLSESEKRAVAFLVLAGQLMAVYRRSNQPDREVLDSFGRLLAMLSPAMALRASSLDMHAITGKENSKIDALAEVSELTHDIGVLIDSVSRVH